MTRRNKPSTEASIGTPRPPTKSEQRIAAWTHRRLHNALVSLAGNLAFEGHALKDHEARRGAMAVLAVFDDAEQFRPIPPKPRKTRRKR